VGAKETATAEEIKDRLTLTLGLGGDRAKADRIFAGVQRCVLCLFELLLLLTADANQTTE